jgi:predicted dienelactone hydrolase
MVLGRLGGLLSVLSAASLVTLAGGCGDGALPTGAGGAASTSSSGMVVGLGGGVPGCDGANLLENPSDTSKPGPSPVGARTVMIDGLTTEVWYPALLGSSSGKAPAEYDVRQWLPPSEMGKIVDAKAPRQQCDCYRDLPLDDRHGPYPVIVFVHGTAGFRTQSLEIMTHWASRGFVVLAADHPGLYLGDLIRLVCGGGQGKQNLPANLASLVAAVKAPAGDLAFLAGHVDAARLAMTGHSAGGMAIAKQGDVAEVIIPMAAGGANAGSAVKSTLVLGAKEDQVVMYSSQQAGFTSSPKAKRLVGISPAGHLTFSSLCSIHNADGEDIVTIGKAAQVCGLSLAAKLFDCSPSYVKAEEGWTIVDDASSAVLEEALQCAPERAPWFSAIKSRYPEVAEVEEQL